MQEFLKGVDLFAPLSAEELAKVAEGARREIFRRGEILFQERQPGGKLYAIESGVVEITRSRGEGRTLRLMRLERGEILGEMALLDEGPCPATATAAVVPETHVVSWEVPPFQALLANDPALASKVQRTLLRKLGQRLRATSDALSALMRTMDPTWV